MKRNVSVVTDSISPNFFFPLWYRYYKEQFGYKSLFLVTYEGLSKSFGDYEFGGIWEIPYQYNDVQRAKSISAISNALLTTSKFVLRVDTDEFLVPNPELHATLSDYIQQLTRAYVTARGFNLMQSSDESKLIIGEPILGLQRKWAVSVGTLHKTALTTIPLQWGPGFHWCSQYPDFDDLFLFHFKHADFDTQLSFASWMFEQVRGNAQLEKYYAVDETRILASRRNAFGLPVQEGLPALYRDEFIREFQGSVHYVGAPGVYHGDGLFDRVLIKIPEIFSRIL